MTDEGEDIQALTGFKINLKLWEDGQLVEKAIDSPDRWTIHTSEELSVTFGDKTVKLKQRPQALNATRIGERLQRFFWVMQMWCMQPAPCPHPLPAAGATKPSERGPLCDASLLAVDGLPFRDAESRFHRLHIGRWQTHASALHCES